MIANQMGFKSYSVPVLAVATYTEFVINLALMLPHLCGSSVEYVYVYVFVSVENATMRGG